MNQTVGPAIQKAYDFVRDNLKQGTWQAGECLPSIRTLSQRAEVSRVTMIKAMAMLKAKGHVRGLERGHLRAGSEDKLARSPAIIPDEAWRTKRAALEQDILSGMYAEAGRLPSSKELQVKYGTCFRTMQKVLRSLVADKAVRLANKKYELGNIPDSPFAQRVVIITYNVRMKPQTALNQGQHRVFDLFEYECMRKGLRVEIVEVDFYNSAETRRAALRSSITAPALGYILDFWWYATKESTHVLQDLLARLAALKRPIAILDEIGDFVLPLQFSANPSIQLFRISGRKAGNRVARLLLGMGHRSVAFFSPDHHVSWSKQRLLGVAEEYAKAGLPNGVKSMIGKESEFNQWDILSVCGFDKRLILRIMSENTTLSATEDTYQSFLQYKARFSSKRLSTEEKKTIMSKIGIIRNLADINPDKVLFDRICNDIFSDLAAQLEMRVRAALFRQAIMQHDATAWICANDNIALSALSYLREQDIAVPQALSIVGFDNAPVEALENRLTSYDFNASGFVHQMLSFIARPPKPRGPYQHVPIEVEGIVMQRDTTASRKPARSIPL
jgi:DNA-binding LacI/PurR family transcriptional regulator/DNA-binding transcriptional regulator YhcF (GntR family)